MKVVEFVSEYDKLPEECTYCGKITKKGDHMFLPNREFQTSRWHWGCVSRFLGESIIAEKMVYKEDYVDYIFDNLPNSFDKLIEKANAREEQNHYRQIVLTV